MFLLEKMILIYKLNILYYYNIWIKLNKINISLIYYIK